MRVIVIWYFYSFYHLERFCQTKKTCAYGRTFLAKLKPFYSKRVCQERKRLKLKQIISLIKKQLYHARRSFFFVQARTFKMNKNNEIH